MAEPRTLDELAELCQGDPRETAQRVVLPLIEERDDLQRRLADTKNLLTEYNVFAFKARKYIHDNLHRRVPMPHCALCKALDDEL